MKPSVGVVVRDGAVETVALRRTLWSATLTGTARVPYEDTAPSGSAAGLVAALSSAIEQMKAPGARIGVALPAQDVLLRAFALPTLPKAEWPAAVQFEVRKHVPFRIEELVWDFHAVEQRNPNRLLVIFAGMRADAFQQLQTCLEQAGIRPTFLEPSSFSLARLVTAAEKKPSAGCTAVVEVAVDEAHLLIMNNRLPHLARHISLVAAEPSRPAAPPVDPRAERLLSELRLSVDFFLREHPGTAVDRLVLFGDPETLRPWSAWLAQQMTCPVELGTLPVEHIQGQLVNPQFACAAGAALRAVRPGPARLDFARAAARARQDAAGAVTKAAARFDFTQIDRRLITTIAKATALWMVVAAVGLAVWAGVWQQRVASLRQRVTTSTAVSEAHAKWGLAQLDRAELEQLQNRVDAQSAFLRDVVERRISVTDKLDALARLLPDGIWLQNVRYQSRLSAGRRTPQQDTTLTITGACFLPDRSGDELNVIRTFVERLKSSANFFHGFEAVQLGQMKLETEERAQEPVTYRTFEVSCASGQRL